MADQYEAEYSPEKAAELTKNLTTIAERSQRILQQFLARQASDPSTETAEFSHIGDAFLELTTRMMTDPSKLFEAQAALWQEYLKLWEHTARHMLGQEDEAVIEPEKGDKRFKDAAWDDNVVFDFVKQSYLLTARWTQNLVADVEGLDEKTARKVDFYTRQFVDAMAPSNFLLSNPEVLRATVDSQGENLVHGLTHLLEDLEHGKGRLDIRMTDTDAFELGRNIAITPGKVIYQNSLMQLIQYAPTTKAVRSRPLLIVPPWINKFYILDLRPDNSFIRWATAQGLTVFVISWVNPDEKLAEKDFANYMAEGPLAALDAIKQATGETDVNAIGYCLGGTLLATTMAYMTTKKDKRIKSATFFASLVDFSEPGELSVFIDEDQLAILEARMERKGYLEGRDMATSFNMLRANDLIWSFVVNNYLLGKEPFPFDLLYWNSDSTRMPAAMHGFYLRNMYHENKLIQAGGISVAGVPIDLRQIKAPIYILAASEDHIAPWKATYAATRIYPGKVRFVLSGSGHIAGVINPPAEKPKYCFWVNDSLPETPDDWQKGATRTEGSWWPDWWQWIAPLSGDEVPPRTPGEGTLKPIEDAPGSYVKMRDA